MSGAPIISGTNQLPKPPIIAGITAKKIISSPWTVTIVFHSCPLVTIVLPGCKSWRAHDDRQHRADRRADAREQQVERPDVLVVGAEQPALREGQLVVVVALVVVGMTVVASGDRHLPKLPDTDHVGQR